jgi:adenylyltransferase/sulfurtransferase
MKRFILQYDPIDAEKLSTSLANPRAGAFVTFEGWVRNHHDAREVEGLEYEAFSAMAVSEGEALLAEAANRFGIVDVRAVHRMGAVGIGERAVWVGVLAEHRQEAFLACRWIMDQIKERLPIWKKESYAGGLSEWVNAGEGSKSSAEDPAENPMYARQVNLSGFGPEGQRRLAGASILVVGAGGLGCPALHYLAAAGVGRIDIMDGDRVDISNLHRQILFTTADIGRNKAEAAAERLRALNPHIALNAFGVSATDHNLPDYLKGMDAVLDGTDSFESKYRIHDTAWQAGVPIIQASVHQREGQLQVFDPRHPEAGCYRCLWPEAPPPGCVGNCAEAGVLGVTPGMLGMYMATETLKLLLDDPRVLRAHTLWVDVFSGETRKLRRSVRPDCPCRGGNPWPEAVSQLLQPGPEADTVFARAKVLDIREAVEREVGPAWIHQVSHAPRAHWGKIVEHFPERPLVLCCAAGVRTRACLELLGNPPGVYAWTRSILEIPDIVKTRFFSPNDVESPEEPPG